MIRTHPGQPPTRVFELDASLRGDALLAGLAALRPGHAAPAAHERLALLDTPDGRLHEAGALLEAATGGEGLVLRLRRAGQPELCSAVPAMPAFARDLPPGPLREALRTLAELRRLQPRLDVERRAAGLDLHDARRKVVARLRVEELRTRPSGASGAWHPLPARLTLQPVRGFADAAAALLSVLRSRPGLRETATGAPDPLLAALGYTLPAPPPAPGADLRAGLRADEALRRVHRAHLASMRWNEAGLRAGLDSEFLHDWRVAVRRTRCLLGQVKQVFPAGEVRRLRAELGWLARLTGPLRDLDVFLLLLQDASEGPAAIDGLQPLERLLRERQAAEHARLVEGLDSPRARELLAEWEAFLARAPERHPEAPHARMKLADLAARRVLKLHKRIAAAGAALGLAAPAAELHALRIAAKKMRYVLDAARRVLAEAPAAAVLSALKRLQQALGEANDAHVQAGLLAQAVAELQAEGRAAPETLQAVGRLAERLSAREATARSHFAQHMAAFSAPATRAALKALVPRGKGKGKAIAKGKAKGLGLRR
jgi:CHAD domain-containing protein